jgi:hypothetical protein
LARDPRPLAGRETIAKSGLKISQRHQPPLEVEASGKRASDLRKFDGGGTRQPWD